ncbi:hypothetical protein ACQKD8_19285 [Pseudomonas sp. NPDC077405]
MSLSAWMKNRWLTIVLALVIALQSLAAIGGTNQSHHPATPHHDHEHSHEVGVIKSSTPDAEPSSSSLDPSRDHASDHCHQNHAHFHMVLVSAATDIAVLSAGRRLSDYQASHISVTSRSLFRPPIA